MDPIYVAGLLLTCLINIQVNSCAKILGVFPSPGYSQYILAESLLTALAQKGHNVTVISGFKTEGVENLRNIVVDLSLDESIPPDMLFRLQELSIFTNIDILNKMCLNINERILSDKNIQALIRKEASFDLVIIETFFSEALQAFAQHFNAHQILFSSTAVSEWNTHLIGNPNIPSYLPTSFAGSTTYMNFYERLRNTMALWYNEYYKEFHKFPAHQKLVDKYFPEIYVLEDFIYNASLMLTCSHVSVSETVPLTKSVIEVGGLHIKSNELPENITKFLDSAKDGAIFFSMGSNVRSASLSEKTIENILAVIINLKQKVLWKFEDDDLKSKPDNLVVSKWFPQSDILAHPNTVAFISHGGLGSTTEAVYHGVPIIGIPVYGDQFMNIRRLVQFGMALELPFKELSGQTLNDSLQEILNNPRYMEAAKRRSKIMKDRPMKPLDEAVYWIEYALRHNGAHHMKSSIRHLPWYKLYLVDITIFVISLLVIFVYIIYVLLNRLRQQDQQPTPKTKSL